MPYKRVIYSVLVYILSMVLVFITKPNIAFTEQGELRSFGVMYENDTTYSVGILSVILAVVIFYTFCIIDLVFD